MKTLADVERAAMERNRDASEVNRRMVELRAAGDVSGARALLVEALKRWGLRSAV